MTKGTIPLWTKKWGTEQLNRKAESIGSLAFDRGFRQKAISPEDLWFPSFFKNIVFNATWRDFVKPKDWTYYVGLDLSNKNRRGNVIQVCALDSKNIRHHIMCRSGNWTSPETAQELQKVDNAFNPQVIKVENNAYQQSIIDWIQENKEDFTFWNKIQPHTTGKNKADLNMGLPSMEVEFANASWKFYCPNRTVEPDDRSDFAIMYREFMSYPASTDDTIMALWFCREAMKHGYKPNAGMLNWNLHEGANIQSELEKQEF